MKRADEERIEGDAEDENTQRVFIQESNPSSSDEEGKESEKMYSQRTVHRERLQQESYERHEGRNQRRISLSRETQTADQQENRVQGSTRAAGLRSFLLFFVQEEQEERRLPGVERTREVRHYFQFKGSTEATSSFSILHKNMLTKVYDREEGSCAGFHRVLYGKEYK